MDKIIQPWGWTGGNVQEMFEVLEPYNLRHGDLQKVAGQCIHPEILRYIDTKIRPEVIPDSPYIYILASNMGAGESWGSNINADRFSRAVLSYIGEDWGIQTFKSAGIYRHHANKDKSKSYGEIPFVVFASALDGYMDRVESIVKIDRERAAKVGAEEVCQCIDRGEFPSWSMGCFPPGTLITMADGEQRPIEDVRLGNHVLSHLGESRRVHKLNRRGYHDTVYRLSVTGHEDLVLTTEHPLWVLRGDSVACSPSPNTVNRGRKQSRCVPSLNDKRKGCSDCDTQVQLQPEWVCADHVEIGDYLLLPIPTAEEPRNDDWSDALLQLMGYYLAEGYLKVDSKKHKMVEFCLGQHETALAVHLVGLLQEVGADWISTRERGSGVYVSCRSARLYDLFREHFGHGAKDKRLSQRIMRLDMDAQRVILGAYADGDGGAYKRALYLSTSSEQLAYQLQLVCLRLSMIANVLKNHHGPSTVVQKDTVEYQVWVGADTAGALNAYTARLELGAEGAINNRRFLFEWEGRKYLATAVISKEEERFAGLVFNFEVEHDESYMAARLAVHNCRVPYDVCTFCGNKAKTRAYYCDHMKQYPNQIITADFYKRMGFEKLRQEQLGLRICVDNPKPVFFDFSRVWIGAAPEAKTLQKVASAFMSSSELADMIYKGAASKSATITKQIQGGDGPVGRTLKAFSAAEPPIPNSLLNVLGSMGMPRALSTTSGLGMVLRPREFQRITLVAGGQPQMADQLDQMGGIFPSTHAVEPCHAQLAKNYFVQALAHMLLSLVPDRSAYGPVLKKRMLRIVIRKNPPGPGTEIDSPVLNKIAALYNGYRLGLLEKVASHGAEILHENPAVLQSVYAETLEDAFSGLTKQAEHLVGYPTVAYLLHAHGFDAPRLMEENPAAATPLLKQAARTLRF